VNRYEIEVAKGNSSYQQTVFIKIGEVIANNATGESSYSFTDLEPGKKGVRYYRLKIINNDGSFSYSLIRPVVFNDEITWQVFPNPSSGVFNFSYQANIGDIVNLKLYDLSGKMVKQIEVKADGFVQKVSIDLNESGYAKGLYLLEVSTGEKKASFRLLKQ
jgi:hypothetical protein